MRFHAIFICLIAATCNSSPVRPASGSATSAAQNDNQVFERMPSLLARPRGGSLPPSFVDNTLIGRTDAASGGSSDSNGNTPPGRDMSRTASLLKPSSSSRGFSSQDQLRRLYYGFVRLESGNPEIEKDGLEALAMSAPRAPGQPGADELPFIEFDPAAYDIEKDRIALWNRYEAGNIDWPTMIETAKLLHRDRRSVIINALFTDLGDKRRSGSSPLSPEKGRGIFADEDMDCSTDEQCLQVVENAGRYNVAIKEPPHGAPAFYTTFPSIDFLLWKPDELLPEFESYGTKRIHMYNAWHASFIQLARDVEKSLSGKKEATGITGEKGSSDAHPFEVVLESLNKIRKYLSPAQEWQDAKKAHVTAWEQIIQIRKALYRSLNHDNFYAYDVLARNPEVPNWADVKQKSFDISKMVTPPKELASPDGYDFWEVVKQQQATSLAHFKQLLQLSWTAYLEKTKDQPLVSKFYLVSLNHALVRLEVLTNDKLVVSTFPEIGAFVKPLQDEIVRVVRTNSSQNRKATIV